MEKLSAMNHPDGDCPLCLLPLVPEDQQSETLPFMKLMSCFHCFHRWALINFIFLNYDFSVFMFIILDYIRFLDVSL